MPLLMQVVFLGPGVQAMQATSMQQHAHAYALSHSQWAKHSYPDWHEMVLRCWMIVSHHVGLDYIKILRSTHGTCLKRSATCYCLARKSWIQEADAQLHSVFVLFAQDLVTLWCMGHLQVLQHVLS